MKANNAQWIGFSVEIGPGGEVFVLDWHDGDICGKEVLNKDTGRIFRITPKQSRATEWAGRYGDLAQLEDAALVQLQLSPSAWHARRARVILQGRAAHGKLRPATHGQLRAIFASHANQDWRLRALWSLHITGGLSAAALTASLADADPYVRAWSIQLLCEDGAPAAAVLPKFATMAKTDSSAVVRLYLAAALQRLKTADRWPIAMALAAHVEDATDHNIPKMVWFGIEPAVVQAPQRALQLAKVSRFPKLANYIARRLTAADLLAPVVAAVGEHAIARRALLEGLRDGLQGRRDTQAPANWRAVREQIRGDAAAGQVATELAQLFGDRRASAELLATLADSAADAGARRQALRALAGKQDPALPGRLRALLDDVDLRRDAIRAVADYDDVNPRQGSARALQQVCR